MLRFFLLLTLAIPTYQVCNNNTCDGCGAVETNICSCDANCGVFRDCCGGALSPPQSCKHSSLNSPPLGADFECQSINLNNGTSATTRSGSFQMVSSCPTCFEDIKGIRSNCTSKDVVLPPVTDPKTGLVYRNEYCAYCNGVEELVTWQTELACSETVHEAILHSNLSTLLEKDPEVIQKDCQEISYREPSLPPGISPPRFCIPTINYCLSREKLASITDYNTTSYYNELKRNCSGMLDPVEGMNGLIYKNPSCALCNAVQIKQCWPGNITNSHWRDDLSVGIAGNVSIIRALFSGSSTSSVHAEDNDISLNTSCNKQSSLITFYCHETPCVFVDSQGTKYCPLMTEEFQQCLEFPLNCTSKKYIFNSTAYNGLYKMFGSWLSCTDDTSCPNGFQVLNKSEYTNFFNGSIKYKEEIIDNWYYDTELQVHVCKESQVDTVGQICHYVAHASSMIGVIVVVLTYSLFKEVRNLTSTIVMNYAIPTLIESSLHLFTKESSILTPSSRVAFAIAFHYLQLSRLTWMAIFSFEVLRKFYLGLRMRKDTKKLRRNWLIAYLCIGWCPAFVIVSVTMVIHFTVHGLVIYGLTSRGFYIIDRKSFLIAEGIYALICCTFSILLFVIITILICSRARAKVKLKQKGKYTLFRLWIVVWTLSCFSYVPYFVNRPQWLIYIVDYYNDSQGLFIFLALYLNKKVLKLYGHLFLKICTCKNPTRRQNKILFQNYKQSPVFVQRSGTTTL